jgi:hypothetical protein
MATLNNPVNAQNIVDRFADYVTATANSSILWGTDDRPFPEFVATRPEFNNVDPLAGPKSGKPIGISAPDSTFKETPITASDIYDRLVAETKTYTGIRSLNAIKNLAGDGGAKTEVFNQTKKAYTSYPQPSITIGTASSFGIVTGQVVSANNLGTFFTALQTAYTAKRDTSIKLEVLVCHSSCHASCHTSRIRR